MINRCSEQKVEVKSLNGSSLSFQAFDSNLLTHLMDQVWCRIDLLLLLLHRILISNGEGGA